MKKQFTKYLILIAAAAGVTGCGRANLSPSAEFLKQKGNIALVWASKSETATFTREGSQGLLDVVVNKMTEGSLTSKIVNTKLDPVVDSLYLKKYGPSFTKSGFQANLVQLPLDKKNLRDVPKKSEKEFWLDLKEFKQKYQVDYVLFLDIQEFGVKQNFFGFIATEAPKARTQVDVYLVDTKDNGIVGEYHAIKELEAKGKWDNPPEYPEMMKAVYDSLQSSLEEAFFGFFNWEKTI